MRYKVTREYEDDSAVVAQGLSLEEAEYAQARFYELRDGADYTIDLMGSR